MIIGGGRILAHGGRDELLAGAGTLVRANDETALLAALDAAGLVGAPAQGGGLVVKAEPATVGDAALAGGVALSQLGAAQGAGLEQLFFDLTSGAEETDVVEVLR